MMNKKMLLLLLLLMMMKNKTTRRRRRRNPVFDVHVGGVKLDSLRWPVGAGGPCCLHTCLQVSQVTASTGSGTDKRGWRGLKGGAGHSLPRSICQRRDMALHKTMMAGLQG